MASSPSSKPFPGPEEGESPCRATDVDRAAALRFFGGRHAPAERKLMGESEEEGIRVVGNLIDLASFKKPPQLEVESDRESLTLIRTWTVKGVKRRCQLKIKRYVNAEEFAEEIGKFMDVENAKRVIEGKEYPSVRLDWAQWYAVKKAFNAPVDLLDIIAEDFMKQKNPRKALEQLARDLLLFTMIADVNVDLDLDETT